MPKGKGSIIAIAVQKGGYSKTTTAAAIADALKQKGKRVLCIDTDPQRNLTDNMATAADWQYSIYDVMAGQVTAQKAIYKAGRADMIPGDYRMIAINKPDMLRRVISPIAKEYDYILIDCAPNLAGMTVNALAAADWLLVPIEADAFALYTVSQLIATVQAVQASENPDLKIAGLLLTKHTGRTVLEKAIQRELEKTAKAIGTRLFKAYIHRAVAVQEAQAKHMSLLDYAPNSKPAADYRAAAAELIKITGKAVA